MTSSFCINYIGDPKNSFKDELYNEPEEEGGEERKTKQVKNGLYYHLAFSIETHHTLSN